MVDSQLVSRGIKNPQVLQAMRDINRSLFVPEPEKAFSFDDTPLSIGWGQTISQPYIVAYMTEKLQLKSTHRVLEIGTGSGYQAAVLSELVSQVFSIEKIPELASKARINLNANNFENITIKEDDGYSGWEKHAPFDAIIVTAAAPFVPEPLMNQLNEGGRMIIPLGPERGTQYLVQICRNNKTYIRQRLIPVRFVPFLSRNF